MVEHLEPDQIKPKIDKPSTQEDIRGEGDNCKDQGHLFIQKGDYLICARCGLITIS